MRIGIHEIAQNQIDGNAIGTVLRHPSTWGTIAGCIAEQLKQGLGFDDKGHALIAIPEEHHDLVVGAFGRTSENPDDYKVVLHRGAPTMVLNRDKVDALPVSDLKVVLYDGPAVLADSQIDDSTKALYEGQRGVNSFLAITFLSTSLGVQMAPGSGRLVRNIAGGNTQWDIGNQPEQWDIGDMLEHVKKACRATIEVEDAFHIIG
jgi:hypothetical protein